MFLQQIHTPTYSGNEVSTHGASSRRRRPKGGRGGKKSGGKSGKKMGKRPNGRKGGSDAAANPLCKYYQRIGYSIELNHVTNYRTNSIYGFYSATRVLSNSVKMLTH